jgi:5-methylcytosine-specific restriction endonuclease McrA
MTERRRGIPARRRFFNPDRAPRSNWERYARDHPERAAIYRSPRWQFERTRQLEREPDCRVCGAPATHVDHLVPLAEGGAPFDASNLESLCARHHGPKTLAESHRGMKRAVAQRKGEPR